MTMAVKRWYNTNTNQFNNKIFEYLFPGQWKKKLGTVGP